MQSFAVKGAEVDLNRILTLLSGRGMESSGVSGAVDVSPRDQSCKMNIEETARKTATKNNALWGE